MVGHLGAGRGGYHYLLGLDNLAITPTAAYSTLSSKITGLRLHGAAHGLSYTLEYARQRDYAGNPAELSSEYYLADTALKAGLEVLGGTLTGVYHDYRAE